MASNQWYQAYEQAFGKLWGAARSRDVTILSVAQELQRILEEQPAELAAAVRLALADALGHRPRRSPEHLERSLLGAVGTES